MARRVSFFVALTGVLLLYAVGTHGATVISSSTIDNCYRDSNGTDASSGLNCSNQIVVQAGTTEIQATIQGAISNGTAVTLENDISIKIYKSAVKLVYPLVYLRTVNSKPYEQMYQRGWSLNPPTCYDGLSAKSTCGWYTNSTGGKILYSNGFCCRCSADGVLHKDDITRGSLDCNPFGLRMSSAHCLRMSNSWWDVYAVDGYTMTYQIILEVSGPGITTYNLTLDQSTPFAKSNNNFMSARIVGDFPAATQPPAFDSYYLAVMATPTDPIFTSGVKNWMMIPREMFDFSGAACNKIGVSFEGFYAQGQRCGVQVGSCLGNQPEALFLADDALRALNKTPTYLLSRWGSFEAAVDDTYYMLQFLPSGISNTLLSLFINADSIRVVTNRSTGKIASATIDNFTTFSRDGKLYVTAANTGALVSTYFLTITNMSIPGILQDIPAQSSSIAPLQSWSTVFDLHAQNRYSSNDWCTVTLYDSSLELIDSVVVYFNTTMYIPDYGSQGGNGTSTGSYVFGSSPSSCPCSSVVGFCMIMHLSACKGQLIAILVIIFVLLMAIVAIKFCYGNKCCGICKSRRSRDVEDGDDNTPLRPLPGSTDSGSSKPSTATKKKRNISKATHEEEMISINQTDSAQPPTASHPVKPNEPPKAQNTDHVSTTQRRQLPTSTSSNNSSELPPGQTTQNAKMPNLLFDSAASSGVSAESLPTNPKGSAAPSGSAPGSNKAATSSAAPSTTSGAPVPPPKPQNKQVPFNAD